jgi:hypothetical protein
MRANDRRPTGRPVDRSTGGIRVGDTDTDTGPATVTVARDGVRGGVRGSVRDHPERTTAVVRPDTSGRCGSTDPFEAWGAPTVRLLPTPSKANHMADFDPERFEDKYANYFTELQRAYKNAFETMNDRFDSELVHAIDQQVLNESEPFYEDGGFRIELPENPTERVTAVVVDEGKLESTLDRYVEEIKAELRAVFGLDGRDEPKA